MDSLVMAEIFFCPKSGRKLVYLMMFNNADNVFTCWCSWPCSALRAESENSGLWTGQEREKGSAQLHSSGGEKLES